MWGPVAFLAGIAQEVATSHAALARSRGITAAANEASGQFPILDLPAVKDFFLYLRACSHAAVPENAETILTQFLHSMFNIIWICVLVV